MTPRVALLNAVTFHTEVYAALLHSFMRAAADVQAFIDLKATSGMEQVIEGWCVCAAAPAARFLACLQAHSAQLPTDWQQHCGVHADVKCTACLHAVPSRQQQAQRAVASSAGTPGSCRRTRASWARPATLIWSSS